MRPTLLTPSRPPAAALASSLLRWLSGTAGLTVATTHHGEIKALAAREDGFVNASVEFDTATLRSTYRLLWGTAGASSALDIAQSLGFDPEVVKVRQQGRAEGRGGLGAALREGIWARK